jgi:hypothetical protein
MIPTSMSAAVREPMLMRVIASPPPGRRSAEEPVVWFVSRPHPFVPGLKVVRMFLNHDGVEVYSLSSDGKAGMRNLIPMSRIRFIEEAMSLDVFVEELAVSKDGSGGEREPEPSKATQAPSVAAEPKTRTGTSTRRSRARRAAR